MKQTKTLAQVANDIENGNNLHEYYNQDGATIKAGNFETFADFLTYYDLHYLPLLRAIRDGEDITPERRHLLNFMADDLIKMFHQDEDTDTEDTDTAPVIEAEDITDTEQDEDPTLTEAEKRDTLARLWDAAWREAQDDPEGTRVIVETNEQDPTAPDNEFGRYYMIDGSLAESGIDHAGQWIVCRVDTVTSPYEVRRPNWAYMNGYADDYTQPACRCENPNNVTRWAAAMIKAGRVTDIYAEGY